MIRRTLLLSSKSNNGWQKSLPDVSKYFAWYPVGGGEFLGDMIAGHNAFIQDIPKKFDAAHARHFALVESISAVPVFTLSIVHYFSLFCQYPTRVDLLPRLQQESADRANATRRWMEQFAKGKAMESIPWRVGLMSLQIATFPFWLLLSSASPAVVHSTLLRVNHIMATKYACIDKNAPQWVGALGKSAEHAEDYHRLHTHITTDFGVAIVILLLLWYLTS